MVKVIMTESKVLEQCASMRMMGRTMDLTRVYQNAYGYKTFAKAMAEVKKDLKRGLSLNKCLEMALQYAG
jgi:hypothetical protein